MPTYTIANRVPGPIMFHLHWPKNRKLPATASNTSAVSTHIFILGKGVPDTLLRATVMPSPGIVTEPHLTSKAIPIPITVHPANCTVALDHRLPHSRPASIPAFRSMSHPKTKPMTSWKSCTGSNLRLRTTTCKTTKTKIL